MELCLPRSPPFTDLNEISQINGSKREKSLTLETDLRAGAHFDIIAFDTSRR